MIWLEHHIIALPEANMAGMMTGAGNGPAATTGAGTQLELVERKVAKKNEEWG